MEELADVLCALDSSRNLSWWFFSLTQFVKSGLEYLIKV